MCCSSPRAWRFSRCCPSGCPSLVYRDTPSGSFLLLEYDLPHTGRFQQLIANGISYAEPHQEPLSDYLQTPVADPAALARSQEVLRLMLRRPTDPDAALALDPGNRWLEVAAAEQ